MAEPDLGVFKLGLNFCEFLFCQSEARDFNDFASAAHLSQKQESRDLADQTPQFVKRSAQLHGLFVAQRVSHIRDWRFGNGGCEEFTIGSMNAHKAINDLAANISHGS